MANRIYFVEPATGNTVFFPSIAGGNYPRKPTKIDESGKVVPRPVGENLLEYLYDYPFQAKSDDQKRRQQAESHFETLVVKNERKTFPKTGTMVDPFAPTERTQTPEYLKLVAKTQDHFYDKSVTVYQRPWCATQSTGERPLISSTGIALCIFVIIYDPLNHKAAAAHLDKDQDSETVANIIPEVFPGNNPLDLYFVGGSINAPNMEEGARKNLVGELNGFFGYCEKNNRQLTIRMFDVIGRPHPNNLIFDTRDGGMIADWWGMPKEVMGQPLDSIFRYWPSNDKYWVEADSSTIADAATELPASPLKTELETVRCQWDGTTGGWAAFKSKSNELICRLIVQYAFDFCDIKTKGLEDVRDEMKRRLIALDMPMMLEQSLKRWVKWSDTLRALGPEKAAVNAGGVTKAKGEATISWEIVKILQKANSKITGLDKDQALQGFGAVLPVWYNKKEFAVPWEGVH